MSIIKTDMAKAKNIHKDYVRFSRNQKLRELDIDFQRALETDDATKKAEVIEKKKALRDAPAATNIEAAKTEAELKAAWDTNLLGQTPY